MQSIIQELTEILGDAFEKADLKRSYGRVTFSDRPDLAQFQCNGAMAAAREARKSPLEIAQSIRKLLSELNRSYFMSAMADHDVQNIKSLIGSDSSWSISSSTNYFSDIDIAGSGFINLKVNDKILSQHLSKIAHDDRSGAPITAKGEIIILDYGGPNIAKPMHVGHLRAAIIGDTVRRILAFSGFKTLGDVHMGDWGTHLGTICNDYIRSGDVDFVLKTDLTDDVAVQKLFVDMGERYPRASAAAKEDEALKAAAQDATLKLQNGEIPYIDMWRVFREASIQGMKKNYSMLNVEFDLWKGEADVHHLIPTMVEDLKAKGFAVEDQGAVIIPVKKSDDTKEYPPLILYKRDGAVMYGTTDLATLVERIELYKPARIIYVVDQRQHLHFEQVFRAAKMSGVVPGETLLTHAGFGTMNGTDGKPFKTRAGGVLRLEDLIEMGLTKARERLHEAELDKDLSEEELDDISHKVAIAAIKFADLQNNRIADYIFDLDRLTQFEGKTGPYLLYQAVRIKSLLNKAEAQDFKTGQSISADDDNRTLLLTLAAFPESVDNAARNYTPHVLCDHAFKLAQEFSAFYAKVHILSESDEKKRGSLILLCRTVYAQLERTLSLLGIDIPEKM